MTFRTLPSRASAVGSVALAVGYLTMLPLVDEDSGLFARLDYADGAARAAELGGRLPTPTEFAEALTLGQLCPPVTLPRGDQLPRAGMSQSEIETFRVSRMLGLEWARYHDAAVRAWLVEHWDLARHVVSIGKHWTDAATRPRDYAALIGWWRTLRIWDLWQPLNDGTGAHRHDLHYLDYSSTTHVWTPTPLPSRPDLVALVLGQIARQEPAA